MTDDPAIEMAVDIIAEIVAESAPNVPREVASAVYREFVQPLKARAEAAENRLKALDQRRGEPIELHESVGPNPIPASRRGAPSMLLCSCGLEWKSSMALFTHQAGALRRDLELLAVLVPVLTGEVERVSAVAMATRAEVVEKQAVIDDYALTIAHLRQALGNEGK